MQITRWDPVREMTRWDPMKEMEEILARSFRSPFAQPWGRIDFHDEALMPADWAPLVDVEETEKEFLIKAELPEVKKEDVKVTIEGGMLSIEGERKHEKEEKTRKLHRVERSFGRFVRRFTLPAEAENAKVGAEFKDGVLYVHVPKMAAARPKTIDIKVD